MELLQLPIKVSTGFKDGGDPPGKGLMLISISEAVNGYVIVSSNDEEYTQMIFSTKEEVLDFLKDLL